MRKDVTLGMTIGGGLLVVALVGSIALSHRNKNHHGVDTTALMNADSTSGSGDVANQSGEDAAKSQDNGSTAKTTDAKPITTPPKSTEGLILRSDPKRDPIADALMNGGSTEPIVSQTPDSNPSNSSGSSDVTDHAPASPKGQPVAPPQKKVETVVDVQPVPPTTPAGPAKPHTHVVQKGETFSTIAAAAYGSANYYPYIMRANPKVDAKALKPNMVLNLPDISEVKPPEKAPEKTEAASPAHKAEATIDASTEYRVVSGDSLNKIALKLYGKQDMTNKLYEANRALIGDNPAALKVGVILKLPQPPVTAATAASR